MNSPNIEEINKSFQESYIHYNPDRVDYTINNLELEMIQNYGNNIWKDVFFSSFFACIPAAINGFAKFGDFNKTKKFELDFFLNSLFALVTLIIAVICLSVWKSNKKKFKNLISEIKDKPKYKLPNSN